MFERREKVLDAGAQCLSDGVQFVVWAPEKKSVEIIISDKRFPLKENGGGYWIANIGSAKAGTLYKISIDGAEPLPDPCSKFQPEGVHGPSCVVDLSFAWNDHAWKGLKLRDMVIYELHVGTFTDEGTFDGVIRKLPYLKDLGVNAIELMPVAQFPGSRNWGYDGVFPFAVQNSYGGPQALQRLVNEAHAHGIAVILDVVYNHLGPEGNYLSSYGPYFTEKYKSFWGQALNFDDAWCDGVRNYFWQNAVMFLRDFHLDGLRLDAVHAIYDFSANHFLRELTKLVRTLEEESRQKKVLIAEFDLNNPRYINPAECGGLGLDGQWVDEYHHALHALITGEKDGYYEDFGEVQHLKQSLKHSYVYTGQWSAHRKKNFGVEPENAYSQFVVFSQNHDQIGNRLLGDRLTSKLSFEQLKLAAAAYMLSPHVPMLFMGEEYGERRPFQYFISHTDKKLVEAVREGRKKEFSYFKWKGEVPDPQAEETFEKCKLSWQVREGNGQLLRDFYKKIISLRKLPALQSDHRNSLHLIDLKLDDVIAFERVTDGQRVVIVLNFSDKDHVVNASALNVSSLQLNSASTMWGGDQPETMNLRQFNLSKYSAALFI